MKLAHLVLAALLFCACTRSPQDPRILNGAGATLPYPLYAQWATAYAAVDPSVRVHYESVGSGAGVRQISDGVIDFGATDEPLTDAELAKVPLVHVPTTVGAVVVAYNVAGLGELRLTADIVADIYLGTITRWDDARIRAENAAAALPAEAIVVVHRADGSGTSATFTNYLTKTSERWRTVVGAGTAPRFPVGVGAKGNEAVAAYVKRTPASIGYVEIAYARDAQIAIALVRNRAGKFVPPSLDGLGRAASVTAASAVDTRMSLVDAADEGAYPIAALTYVIVPRDTADRAKATALSKFLWWAVHDGQRLAPALGYAPLPPALVTRAESALRELRSGGQPVSGS